MLGKMTQIWCHHPLMSSLLAPIISILRAYNLLATNAFFPVSRSVRLHNFVNELRVWLHVLEETVHTYSTRTYTHKCTRVQQGLDDVVWYGLI
jgi:hypothetical protein